MFPSVALDIIPHALDLANHLLDIAHVDNAGIQADQLIAQGLIEKSATLAAAKRQRLVGCQVGPTDLAAHTRPTSGFWTVARSLPMLAIHHLRDMKVLHTDRTRHIAGGVSRQKEIVGQPGVLLGRLLAA